MSTSSTGRRVGPEPSINPAEQLAYYDAGLGSRPPSGGLFKTVVRMAHNFLSEATGFGLTTNIRRLLRNDPALAAWGPYLSFRVQPRRLYRALPCRGHCELRHPNEPGERRRHEIR